jgi:hypothetical protein
MINYCTIAQSKQIEMIYSLFRIFITVRKKLLSKYVFVESENIVNSLRISCIQQQFFFVLRQYL